MRVGVLLLAVILSGCLSSAPDEPTVVQPLVPTSTTSAPTVEAAKPAQAEELGRLEGFVRDPSGPIAGADVVLLDTAFATASDAEGGFVLSDIPKGAYTIQAREDSTNRSASEPVTLDGTALVFLSLPAIEVPPEIEPEPLPPATFQCPDGIVQETFPTFGVDATDPSLVWAALKTGFRAVVAWETPSATAEVLEYSVGGKPYRELSQTVPSTSHVFVVDNLRIGDTFCFHAPDGGLHALRLGNAGNGVDAASGIYTSNLLVLANEQSDRAVLEAGLEVFADTLWDATDGYVRSGINIVVYNDPTRHNSGWTTCYVPGISTPTCNFAYDVIFTLDAFPGGAASTYRDGISDPAVSMWMNWYWQAHPGSSIFSLDNVGNVLTHEMGHYMLGMMDMYPPSESTNTGECWNAATEISIMGGSRSATEFDDEVNRCPNEAEIIQDRGEYVPAWTSMVERYANIPQRTGAPNPGPIGNGGAFGIYTFDGVGA